MELQLGPHQGDGNGQDALFREADSGRNQGLAGQQVAGSHAGQDGEADASQPGEVRSANHRGQRNGDRE